MFYKPWIGCKRMEGQQRFWYFTTVFFVDFKHYDSEPSTWLDFVCVFEFNEDAVDGRKSGQPPRMYKTL